MPDHAAARRPEDTIRRARSHAEAVRYSQPFLVLADLAEQMAEALTDLWLNPDRPPAVIAETARKGLGNSSQAECVVCDGRGYVSATPGHPEDGPMPCDHCDGTGVILEPGWTAEEPSREIPCANCSSAEVARLREALEVIGSMPWPECDSYETLQEIARAALVRDPSQDRETANG
jgi:hypothetical protein